MKKYKNIQQQSFYLNWKAVKLDLMYAAKIMADAVEEG
jgi:hypothetical protein